MPRLKHRPSSGWASVCWGREGAAAERERRLVISDEHAWVYRTGLTYMDVGADSRGGEDYAFTGGTLQDGDSLTGDVVQVVSGSSMFEVAAPSATPEPSAVMSIALGAVGLGALRLRARRRMS